MVKCKYCGKEISVKGLSHEKFCQLNPDRIKRNGENNPHFGKKGSNQYSKDVKMSDDTKKKISIAKTGKNLSEKHKLNVSVSMKKAHLEKRAWNIGMSRWNNKKSYPEKFFIKVIENEFIDKNYKNEYSIGIYSLDFAWIHKKKCIEIDGKQHERFEEYKVRDRKKDIFLKENGWSILRISWKEMYDNPKQKIKEAYNFIHDGEA